MNIDKYQDAVNAAMAGYGSEPWTFWVWKCVHGMTLRFSWECPACAKARINRLQEKLAAYQFAARVRRDCGK